MVRRIVSCNDLVYEELKEAYDVVKDYLCEALGRYGVESFAMFGTFYFIDNTPTKNECIYMGFENTLDSLTYEYTDEITIYTGDSCRVLLNPTFICEENDYVYLYLYLKTLLTLKREIKSENILTLIPREKYVKLLLSTVINYTLI